MPTTSTGEKDGSDPRTIYGGPTKRFFVSMLTRDIEFDAAVLDLIDNSVDGAMRLTAKAKLSKLPYKNYWARLTVTKDKFVVIDNCGGIPDSRLDAAFRLGRPQTHLDRDIPTIGMYGIGMKRAIFKMGREAVVESSSVDGVRRVHYTKSWLDDQVPNADQNWDLPIARSKPRAEKGVKITVSPLKPDASRSFGNSSFIDELKRKIGTHFGYLILRGFTITVNGENIEPSTLRLYVTDGKPNRINPFDYVAFIGPVRIRVTLGFYRGLPPVEELDEEDEGPRSRDNAGVSVLCNDRVILHNDTTFRTGWGTRAVPKFHNQFMAIGD